MTAAHAVAGELPWVINAYLLPLSALLLLGGAAGDRFGRRRMLIVGTVLFAAASITLRARAQPRRYRLPAGWCRASARYP